MKLIQWTLRCISQVSEALKDRDHTSNNVRVQQSFAILGAVLLLFIKGTV